MMGAIEGALRPPRAWEVLLRGLHSIMSGFGRLSFLVDENTAAMHFFVSALLTLCDRCTTPLTHLLIPAPPSQVYVIISELLVQKWRYISVLFVRKWRKSTVGCKGLGFCGCQQRLVWLVAPDERVSTQAVSQV